MPDLARKVYDVRDVIRAVVDNEEILEVSERWARNMVTAYCRIDGRSVGVIANQPWYLGGVIDADAAQKAAKFVRTCNSYGIPLVVFVDTPGFLPGTKQEGLGVIRHGAKLLHAFAEAVVPKMTVVLRKAYGGGFITMNSKDLGADLALAWPDAQIGIMGPKQAVGIVHKREIAAAEDPEAEHDRLAAAYADEHVSAAVAAREGFIDELVEPGRDPAPAGGRARRAVGRRRLRQRRREHPAVTCTWPWATASRRASSPSAPRWPDELARSLGGRYVNLAEVGATSEQVERGAARARARAEARRGDARLRRERRAVQHAAGRRGVRRASLAHVRRACGASCRT